MCPADWLELTMISEAYSTIPVVLSTWTIFAGDQALSPQVFESFTFISAFPINALFQLTKEVAPEPDIVPADAGLSCHT